MNGYPLAELRDGFASRNDDLRHLLLTIDSEVCVVPTEWANVGPGAGYSRWGLPPDNLWRHLSGKPVPWPIIEQAPEFAPPFCYKHTFYGRDGAARESFRNLAYRAIRCLTEAPTETLARLAQYLGLPYDPPNLQDNDPSYWWMRAVHALARRRHIEVPDLWATRAPAAEPISRDFEADRRARQQRRADVGEFSSSILHADVFACSAWSLDLILKTIPRFRKIVCVQSGDSLVYADIRGCQEWPLDFSLYYDSPDFGAGKPKFRDHPTSFGGSQFRILLRTDDHRYLLVGAPGRYWHLDRLPTGDGLTLLLNEPQRHWDMSRIPASERRYHEIDPRDALLVLVQSGHSDSLPDDLQRLLDAHLTRSETEPDREVPAGDYPGPAMVCDQTTLPSAPLLEPPDRSANASEESPEHRSETGLVGPPIEALPSGTGISSADGLSEGRSPEVPAVLADLVTLNQAAGAVHRSKRTLERYKSRGSLPLPVVEGGGGRPDLYDWKTF